MPEMTRLLILLALLCPQDADLIRRLGDDDPAVRDRASLALESRGNAAVEALEKGAVETDLETRTRALDLLLRLDPMRDFPTRSATQRPFKLKVLAPPKQPDAENIIIDGAVFNFGRRTVWQTKGEVHGSIFHIVADPLLDGELDWTVASVRATGELPFERCAKHPHAIYLPGESMPPCTITLKGTRRWFCEVPVEFRNPEQGQSRRVGPYTLTIKWPRIELGSDAPMRESTLALMLRPGDFQYRVRPGREKEFKIHEPTDEPAIFFPEAQESDQDEAPLAWCKCANTPDRSKPRPKLSTIVGLQMPWNSFYALGDLSAIKVMFRVPVEEPFEVTSPPLD